ncbi:DUF87 domain-containing protein [Candidatus Parcubacteria bacterium]|nr:MAG: DUF87 domain-containing protein [Candidatus Parcubacteria bacterium]
MAEENNNNITYFGETNFRNERKRFGIKRRDRARHMYVIGKTGVGKTTLLENMAIQDILNGEGVGIVDPHGEFAEKMLKFVPENRIEDVLYFAPHDINWPIAFNVMENVDPTQRHLVANGLLGVFKKIWPDVWSPRMEYILNNCILALLEYPDSTLLGINRMLSDKNYRNEVVSNISDPVVKAFWTDEFAKYTDRFMTEAGAAIQNKVGQFISNPLIRNIIGQPKSSFDIRDLMDQKKIFLMDLSKGRIGEENSRLIGAMLITKIYLAAMSRVDVPENERRDFYLYVDEFQNFANESFKDILSEARKYRLNLVLAHQYVAQMDESVKEAVIGNVGTLITFRVGAFDAELLEKEFSPEFTAEDIVSLGFGNIYLKLMIDGMASRAFSAETLPPIKIKAESCEERIIEFSRDSFATSRKEVEDRIAEWHAQIATEIKAEKEFGRTAIRKSIPHPSARDSADQPQVFESACSICGKKTYVPFQPDGKRAVYCKVHRAAGQAQQAQSQNQSYQPPQKLPVSSGVRTLKSSFQKSNAGTQGNEAGQTISLSELDRRKKMEPKLDELRKVLGEVLEDEEGEEEETDESDRHTGNERGAEYDKKDTFREQITRAPEAPEKKEKREEKIIRKEEAIEDLDDFKRQNEPVILKSKPVLKKENQKQEEKKVLKPGDKVFIK